MDSYEGYKAITIITLYLLFAMNVSIDNSSAFEELFEKVSYDRAPIIICGHIAEKATTWKNISLEEGVSAASFFLNWTGDQSSLEFDLISPDGKRIDQYSNNIEHVRDSTYEYYFLSAPKSGIWTAEITAVDLKTTEDDYCLTVDRSANYTIQQGAKLNRLFFDKGADKDYDELDDTIHSKVGVNIKVPGIYILSGSLYDIDNIEIYATNRTFLDIGAQWIFLEFSGSNTTGKRRLANLTLYDELGNKLDYISEARQTETYDNIQQEAQMARLSGDYSDMGIDTNGDGLYDILNMEVGVDVLSPGEYTLSGSLYDMKGTEIAWSIDHSKLDTGYHKMHLDFDGKSIWDHNVNGPYTLGNLQLSGNNWSINDLKLDACTTFAYNASQFVDPVYPEKIISGSGKGELLLKLSITETIPVFYGRFSQDIVDINIPPLSSPYQVNGSTSGYAYDAEGISIPGKPNNFTIIAHSVKDLNIGLRKDPVKNGINASRTWISSQIEADIDGMAVVRTDLISPGSYHVKIFGDAANNATEVDLVLTAEKKVVVNGPFNLSINTTGFPAGNYSMTTKAINGTFEFDELNIGDQL